MPAVQDIPVSRVFVELCPREFPTEDQQEGTLGNHIMEVQENRPVAAGARVSAPREVHVSAVAELSAAPDRARVFVQLSSSKETAAEAKGSVSRRLEYILQSLRQHGVQEDNMNVARNFRRRENVYTMDAEVSVTFDDFEKMQTVCNLLIEKLDSSVTITPPHFYHTPGSLENLRRRVCLAAVENARRKAQDVCRLVGQALGKPLLIREDEMKEWECQADNHQDPLSMQQKIKSATVSAASRVFATFEIKAREKSKKHL